MHGRKVRQGVVVSDRMDKTVVVQVERLVAHPVYRKYIRKRKKYKVHDPQRLCRVGDVVSIVETRPLSRHKRWKVQDIIRKVASE